MKLIINRPKVRSRFTMVNNLSLQDERLSMGARGLLSYFLSLPPNWDFNIESFCSKNPDGLRKIRGFMKELSKFGYLHTNKQRSRCGRIHWVINVYELATSFRMGIEPVVQNDIAVPLVHSPLVHSSPAVNVRHNNNNNNNTYNNKDDIFINKNISCLVNETDQISSNSKEPKKLKEKQKEKREQNKIFNEGAIEVIDFLNEKTGKNFRKVDTNLNLIVAILKTDATISNCRQVIAKKYREWTGTKMEEYLRPKSLFNKTNFEQYLGELVLPKD